MRDAGRGRLVPPLLAIAIVAVLVASLGPASGAAPAPTTFPNRTFLSQLSLPSTATGTDSGLSFQFSNPLNRSLTGLVLTFALYEFIPPPGGAASALPSGSPSFSVNGALASEENLTLASLPTGSYWGGSISVHVPSGTPAGTYGVRDQAVFTENGSSYRLASRGFFTDAQWSNATTSPNGTPTLNLTRLGVAAVLPETALLVENPTALNAVLYALLGGAVGLVGVATYLWWRRTGSSSGARGPDRNKAAESA
jgi:hypothetical protein